MSVIRGCDNAPKEDPCKALARCIRYVLLHSFSDKPSSFIENVDDDELKRRMVAVLSSHDEYPVHYIMHLLHATEIIGYKHPDNLVNARGGNGSTATSASAFILTTKPKGNWTNGLALAKTSLPATRGSQHE